MGCPKAVVVHKRSTVKFLQVIDDKRYNLLLSYMAILFDIGYEYQPV